MFTNGTNGPPQSDDNNPFADIDNFGRTANIEIDELEEYLNTPTVQGKLADDPLRYWATQTPSPLSRMASDYLLAPGKSTNIRYIYCNAKLSYSVVNRG
jgi:hypothetical protein